MHGGCAKWSRRRWSGGGTSSETAGRRSERRSGRGRRNSDRKVFKARLVGLVRLKMWAWALH
jgi:hypothetical protein